MEFTAISPCLLCTFRIFLQFFLNAGLQFVIPANDPDPQGIRHEDQNPSLT
jgi:hypothetical protein